MSLHSKESIPKLHLNYLPVLDGLRAVSISFVLLGHFGLGKIIPGGFGVTVFFFISGFLITRLLLAEIYTSGRIRLVNFYMRRLVRLVPALVVFVVVTSVVFFIFNRRLEYGAIAASLTYTMNYYRIFTEVQSEASGQPYMSTLGILWSLAVEEHYYIIYPLALGWLVKTGRTVPALSALVVLALVWRIIVKKFLMLPDDYTYMATDCRFDSIIYGALLACIFSRESVASRAQKILCSPIAVCVAVSILMASFLVRDPFLRETIRYSAQGLALMPIVASLTYGSRVPGAAAARSVLSTRPAVFFGKLSYSLYLWHYSGIIVADYLMPHASTPQRLPIMIGFAALASLASYLCVERSFMALRHRLGSGAV